MGTLAETSAQGNSNEEETVRETQKEGEWGERESTIVTKSDKKNEMGEC